MHTYILMIKNILLINVWNFWGIELKIGKDLKLQLGFWGLHCDPCIVF